MRNTASFFRRFSRILQIFWIAACGNALYILRYIHTFLASPAEAMAAGMQLSLVPAMTEHVLMSAALLLLGGIGCHLLYRSFMK